jgi:hypothetical protein
VPSENIGIGFFICLPRRNGSQDGLALTTRTFTTGLRKLAIDSRTTRASKVSYVAFAYWLSIALPVQRNPAPFIVAAMKMELLLDHPATSGVTASGNCHSRGADSTD